MEKYGIETAPKVNKEKSLKKEASIDESEECEHPFGSVEIDDDGEWMFCNRCNKYVSHKILKTWR